MTVAAFSPSPAAHGAGGLEDDGVLVARLDSRRVEARQLELDPDDVGGEDAQGLVEELLPGVVPSSTTIFRVSIGAWR